MARGWDSIHPWMASALRELGVTEGQITQGWGYAPASANYHAPEGRTDKYPAGHPYSSCVDLSWSLRSQGFKDRMVAAGFCPFFRDWAGNQHIHAVFVGARDGENKVRLLPGPRTQVVDYTRGRDGLVGHDPLAGELAPTPEQREQVRVRYEAWAPQVGTRVYSPEGAWIPCYAFLERDAVRCEARAFLTWWGVYVTWRNGQMEATYRGQALDLSAAKLRLEGQFTRGEVRALGAALGLGVEFDWAPDGSATVRVEY